MVIKELTDSYVPDKILHREKQIKRIKDIFINFKNLGFASNLLIQGVTGSGKTISVMKVISDVGDDNYFYTTATQPTTTLKTLKSLFDTNKGATSDVIVYGIKKLKEKPRVLIIDEVNKIKDITEFFNALNAIYRETGCPIIIITNKRTIIKDMPDDARLTLFFERVNFPAYNAKELKDILMYRLEKIKNKIPEIPESAINYICALGAREGSARIVLGITLRCILENNFSEEFIRDVMDNIDLEDWKSFINGLSKTEKVFLKTLLMLKEVKDEITSSDISRFMDKLSPSRISQLITTFVDYGVINYRYKNMGRHGGRMRIVNFVSDEIYKKLNDLIDI